LFDTADVLFEWRIGRTAWRSHQGPARQASDFNKTSLPMGDGPGDAGSSRIVSRGRSMPRWSDLARTTSILLQLHAFDAGTPIDEVFTRSTCWFARARSTTFGVSNFSGWQLMKSLGIAAQNGWPRYAAHQVYYSLVGRDTNGNLMPLGLDQGVGALVWSPLGWGRLTGRIRRGQPLPEGQPSPCHAQFGPLVSDERLYHVIDHCRRSPTISARAFPQVRTGLAAHPPDRIRLSSSAHGTRFSLRDNLGAIGWSLTTEQIAQLNAASDVMPAYPYYPYRTQEASPAQPATGV